MINEILVKKRINTLKRGLKIQKEKTEQAIQKTKQFINNQCMSGFCKQKCNGVKYISRESNDESWNRFISDRRQTRRPNGAIQINETS